MQVRLTQHFVKVCWHPVEVDEVAPMVDCRQYRRGGQYSQYPVRPVRGNTGSAGSAGSVGSLYVGQVVKGESSRVVHASFRPGSGPKS